MHRRGSLILSLILLLHLSFGPVTVHLVSLSNIPDHETNSEDEGYDPTEEISTSNTIQTSATSNAEADEKEPENKEVNCQISTTVNSQDKEVNCQTSTTVNSQDKEISCQISTTVNSQDKEVNCQLSTTVNSQDKEVNCQISTTVNSQDKEVNSQDKEDNDQISTTVNSEDKEVNCQISTIVNSEDKEDIDQIITRMIAETGDTGIRNKEYSVEGMYISDAVHYHKENSEEDQKEYDLYDGLSDLDTAFIAEEDIPNSHNNVTSHTNDKNHEYEFAISLPALLLISTFFGYRNSITKLRIIKQSLTTASQSRRHQIIEKSKNALNTNLNELGIELEKLIRDSLGLHVKRKLEHLCLPLRSSRETRSAPNRTLYFGETVFETGERDLPDHLQSTKSEVVSLKDSVSDNDQRTSANRSRSNMRRMARISVQKFNKKSKGGNEVGIDNNNTYRGGKDGETMVMSPACGKTLVFDVSKSSSYQDLENVTLTSSTESASISSCPRNFGETPVEISKSDLLDYIKTKKYQIREVISIKDYHSGKIQRISADRSVLDIVREIIPGNGSSKVTVKQINTRTHGRSEGQIINDNTNKGGNQGAVIVISFDGSKTDIRKHVSDFELRNFISKGFRFSNFTSKTDSQNSHGSEATELNTEVRHNGNQSKYLYDMSSLNKSDKKKDDVKEKELLEEIQDLLDKLSDDIFDKDLFTGGRNASPMDSFEKGKLSNSNPRPTEMHSTQSETMLINLGSYRKFPTSFITNNEVRTEFLVSSLNILRRKGMLRDPFSVPPNVIDPFNVSFELTKEDFRREFVHAFQRPTASEWSHYFDGIMSNHMLRYASFSNWSINAPFSATRLVTAGFFYDNQKRAIYCFNCGIEVNCTGGQLEMFAKQRITPIQFHLSLNPRCEHALSEMHRNEKVDVPSITTTSEDIVNAGMNDLCITDQKSSSAPGSVPRMRPDIGKDVQITEGRRNTLPDNIAAHSGVIISDNNIPENRQERHDHHSSYNSHDSPSGRTNVVHNGVFEYNYPVKTAAYKDIYSRLESYRGWPIRNIQDPKELVHAGFFYTNKKDIVRCFCCDIGLAEWDKDDDPWLEHARHSPDCKYLKEKKGQEYIDSIQLEWQKIYKPKHPAYNELKTRLDSFTGWPEELTQKPDVLAAAGFFYTGEGDVARCHYCDGGLREWEPGDDPWTEHARWFPYCKYLIKLKGLEYIEQIARQSESGQHEQSSGQSNQLNVFSNDSILTNHQSNSQQQIITNNRENPMDTTAAKTLLAIGYKRHEVQFVTNRFVGNHGNRHFTAENLLDIIMDMEDRGETIPETSANDGNTNGISNENIEPHLVQLENKRLKEQMLCVTCKREDRTMVLIPCGHRLHCESCSQSVKRCPNCKKKVNKIVKTFLA